MALTINALARVREKERKFPELSAYYYVLSATSGRSFCSRSSFLFFSLSPSISLTRLAFTTQQVEKGRQAFGELKPGHTQTREM